MLGGGRPGLGVADAQERAILLTGAGGRMPEAGVAREDVDEDAEPPDANPSPPVGFGIELCVDLIED